MKKILSIALIIFFISILCASENSNEDNFYFDAFQLSLLPGGLFLNTGFENFFPSTTFLIEESNGFSLLDIPKVYFEGESPLNFNYYFEGFGINSALYPGGAAFLPPLLQNYKYRLVSGDSLFSGIYESIDKNSNQNKIYLSTVYSELGSYLSIAPSLMNKHPETRNEKLYDTRRKILSNTILGISRKLTVNDSELYLSFSYLNLKRQFNDFEKTKDSTFDETGELFSFISFYEKNKDNYKLKLITALNKKYRDNLNSEFGRLFPETFKQNYFSFFTGSSYSLKDFFLNFSLLYESENRNPNFVFFTKELMDNDGDGFFPFERIGKFRAFTLSLSSKKIFSLGLNNSEISFFADLKFTSLRGEEDSYGNTQMYFNSKPLYYIIWDSGEDYKNSNKKFLLGTEFKYTPFKELELSSRFYLKASSLTFENSEKNILFLGPAFDLNFNFFNGGKAEISLYYAQLPQDVRENLNFFLEDKRPSGIVYDVYGKRAGYTGGKYHFVSDDLKIPYERKFIILSKVRLSKVFGLSLKGVYKKFKNNLWVFFDKYDGYYKNVDNFNLYFPSSPNYYYLSNYRFSKDPFYAEFLIDLHGRRENKWFFSFSFMAHIGMGYTSFGNGPVDNDIGNISESMASPDTWINGYGRVDGDRAFVGRILFGFHILKNLTFGGNIKYRDGEPFAFIKYYFEDGKIALYYPHIQAEDERGVKGGPREDCIWDMSFKLKYSILKNGKRINIFASVFNLFDIGAELSEYVFTPEKRNPMELQLPRSLRVGIEYEF